MAPPWKKKEGRRSLPRPTWPLLLLLRWGMRMKKRVV
jgi:hypothetical protein